MKNIALITGITGQDGSFLAEFLLGKGYEVHGTIRRSSVDFRERIAHLEGQPHFHLHYADMGDSMSLIQVVSKVRPTEIYNLAAQSHVQVSFDSPEFTADVDATGVLRVLEAVRQCGLADTCRIYQASTSELYGKVEEVPQNENTPFHPYSPYAVAKLYGYWIVKEYREAYNMFCCSGILFNHESERRGETFVTRKITLAAARIAQGKQEKLYLGNLSSLRDWGYAKDYVECMWLILQHDKPEDFVIATGVQHSVRDFCYLAFKHVGIELEFKGEDENNQQIIDMLGTVVEYRNLESGEHIKRVKGYTGILAECAMKEYPEYGLTEEKINTIVAASSLHDIGKITIPDGILLKPGRLTEDEYEYMKSHTIRGCE